MLGSWDDLARRLQRHPQCRNLWNIVCVVVLKFSGFCSAALETQTTTICKTMQSQLRILHHRLTVISFHFAVRRTQFHTFSLEGPLEHPPSQFILR